MQSTPGWLYGRELGIHLGIIYSERSSITLWPWSVVGETMHMKMSTKCKGNSVWYCILNEQCLNQPSSHLT